MTRKKRRFDAPVAAEPAADTAAKPRYQDPFQQKVGRSIEEAGKLLEGKGRNILYGLAAIVVLALIVGIVMTWSGRSNAQAQTALGKAIVTSQSAVTDQAPPAGSTERTFKTQRERAEAAIAEFEMVRNTYGGSVGEKAKYFIAVNRLTLDRQAGIAELEALAKTGGEVGSLSKFALAQAKATDGVFDQAASLYQELAASSDPIVAKETINFELAKIYEKQGKKAEAVTALFDLVKAATEAKDRDGKAVPLSSTAQNAKTKLQELDAEKAKELPEPPPAAGSPFGL